MCELRLLIMQKSIPSSARQDMRSGCIFKAAKQVRPAGSKSRTHSCLLIENSSPQRVGSEGKGYIKLLPKRIF
jgi:hypothetical protein